VEPCKTQRPETTTEKEKQVTQATATLAPQTGKGKLPLWRGKGERQTESWLPLSVQILVILVTGKFHDPHRFVGQLDK
jgi:hypothetical protein